MKLSEFRTYPKLSVNTNKLLTDEQGFAKGYKEILTGIEVEVENLSGNIELTHSWDVTNDGSLRNHGMEFILYPSAPNQVEEAIIHLFTRLPKSIHFSPRTSIHVHLNCRELTTKQIYNIVILYQCFEDLLYDFAGKERKKSIFCVPIGSTQYYNGFKTYAGTADLFPAWSKYTGLNLCPLAEYGTVEFRHLRGTADKAVIFKWLHLLYSLYTFATETPTDALENIIQDTCRSGNVDSFGRLVFGNHFYALQSHDFQKKMLADMAISKLFMLNNTRNIMEGKV